MKKKTKKLILRVLVWLFLVVLLASFLGSALGGLLR